MHVDDRIGQLILERISPVKLQSTSSLSSSMRGAAGFDNSGMGIIMSSFSTGQIEEIFGTGPAAVRRLTPERGTLECLDEPSEKLLSVRPHVFFEGVFFAKESETLPHFIRRVRSEELKNFKWMFPDQLIEEFENPGRRSPVSLQLEAI